MPAEKLCYVISAIGAPGSTERKHADLVFNYIIRRAIERTGYRLERSIDSHYSGLVSVEIINSLLDADLVIADLSFLNPNVFYELGVRHSTKLPTIHIAAENTILPFDTAGHRAIFYDVGDWDSHEKARKLLRRHIGSAETDAVTNPVTSASSHQNDIRLSGIIDGVSGALDILEKRIGEITAMPPPGPIRRSDFEKITTKHRSEILELVEQMRRRIDAELEGRNAANVPHVSAVLQRLNIFKDFMQTPTNPDDPTDGHTVQ